MSRVFQNRHSAKGCLALVWEQTSPADKSTTHSTDIQLLPGAGSKYMGYDPYCCFNCWCWSLTPLRPCIAHRHRTEILHRDIDKIGFSGLVLVSEKLHFTFNQLLLFPFLPIPPQVPSPPQSFTSLHSPTDLSTSGLRLCQQQSPSALEFLGSPWVSETDQVCFLSSLHFICLSTLCLCIFCSWLLSFPAFSVDQAHDQVILLKWTFPCSSTLINEYDWPQSLPSPLLFVGQVCHCVIFFMDSSFNYKPLLL